jgi:prepilin-type N-terminal cleavage/methylation domain-containing protein
MMQKGFTLLELSIVLVIIGLVVGGVTVGASLVKEAELQGITKDIESVKASAATFRLKYNQLPGDFDKGWDYWGSNCAVDAATCNGDNNGLVNTLPVVVGEAAEFNKVCAHLRLAGLLPGDCIVSVDRVSSRHKSKRNTIITLWGTSPGGQGWTNTTPANKNYVYVLKASSAASGGSNIVFMTPAEAFAIDSKIDNGAPGNGRMFSNQSSTHVQWATNCASSDNAMTATYNVSDPTIQCSMSVIAGID